MRTLLILAVTLSLLMPGPAFAEIIFFKDGRTIHGQVVETQRNALKVKVDEKIETISMDEVIKIMADTEALLEAVKIKGLDQIPEEKKELIRRLLDANGARQSIGMIFTQIIEEASPQARGEAKELFKTDEIIDLVLPIYDKYYSTDELKELVTFYKGATGQKYIRLTPVIMDETLHETAKFFKAKQAQGKKN